MNNVQTTRGGREEMFRSPTRALPTSLPHAHAHAHRSGGETIENESNPTGVAAARRENEINRSPPHHVRARETHPLAWHIARTGAGAGAGARGREGGSG